MSLRPKLRKLFMFLRSALRKLSMSLRPKLRKLCMFLRSAFKKIKYVFKTKVKEKYIVFKMDAKVYI